MYRIAGTIPAVFPDGLLTESQRSNNMSVPEKQAIEVLRWGKHHPTKAGSAITE
jgi:hypothetical protein